MSVDPLTKSYPFYSPYQFAANTPILAIDVDGLESDVVINEAEKFLFTPYEWRGKNPASEYIGLIKLNPREYERVKPMLINIKHLEPAYMEKYTIPKLQRATKDSWKNLSLPTDSEFETYRSRVYGDIGNNSRGMSVGIDCSGLMAKAYSKDRNLLFSFNFVGSENTFGSFLDGTDQLDIAAGIVFNDPSAISEADLLYKNGHILMATGNVFKENGKVTSVEIIESSGSGGVNTRFMNLEELGKYKFLHPFRTSDPGYQEDPTNKFEIWQQTIEQKQYDVPK